MAEPAPMPVRSTARRRATSEPVAAVRRSPKAVSVAPRGRLADRRKNARRARLIALVLAAGILSILFLIASWLTPLRIQSVTASGPNAEGAQAIAQDQLGGSYAFIVPRDSTFFYPESGIREAVLGAYPDIAAISLRRSSFTSLALTTVPRSASALWCGEMPNTATTTGCYALDPHGLIFGTAQISTSSPSVPRLYGPITGDVMSPVGSSISHAAAFMDILRFVRAIEGLGVDVAYTVLTADEATLHAEVGTRLLYVVGNEKEAASTAAAALPPLDIPSGAYDYVDLRFGGKAYAKRFGE